MTENTTPDKPSLLRHFAAMVYDSFLLIALVAVVDAIAVGMVAKISGDNTQLPSSHLVQLLVAISIIGFFSLFWRKSGQTLGMQAWRIQLVDASGHPPGIGKCILRCIGAAFSIVFLGLGYLWRLVDRNKRYWHDYFSQTELILLPKAQKQKDNES
jgi:uncharacterized RDD family membrane protein YckC